MELTRITTRVYKRDKWFLVWVFWVFTALLGLKLNSDIMVGLQKAKASKNIKEGKKAKALSQKSSVQRRNYFVGEVYMKRLLEKTLESL